MKKKMLLLLALDVTWARGVEGIRETPLPMQRTILSETDRDTNSWLSGSLYEPTVA
jgi:hypothetical protein